MTLTLVGLSHHVAPVELRERVTLDLGRGRSSRGRSATRSACRRATAPSCTSRASTSDRRSRRCSSSRASLSTASLYRLHEDAAALHLFRVAAGLDSLVPGEGEILGQVRDAYEAAQHGALLDRVFRQALAGRQARAHGDRDRREPGVGLVRSRALAAQVFGDLTGRRVMLIGAGRIGELAAANLASRGARDRVHREPHRRHRARAGPSLRRRGAGVARDRQHARRRRRRRLVDERARDGAAGGRRAGAACARRCSSSTLRCRATSTRRSRKLDGCFLYDIDDLEAVVAETLVGRRSEAARAEQLVAEEAERFRSWRASLDVVPAIASLRARAEEIRSAELAKVDGRLSATTSARTLESVTAQILNKLLHLPTVRMKEAAVSSDGAAYADAVRHLFGLEEERMTADVRRSRRIERPLPVVAPSAFMRIKLGARRAAGASVLGGRAVLVRIGSRGSRLALTQAEQAAARCAGPGSRSRSSRSRPPATATARSPFGQIGERGVFVKEIEEALLAGRSTSPCTRRRT